MLIVLEAMGSVGKVQDNFQEIHVELTIKHGISVIMAWVCFGVFGVVKFCCIYAAMDVQLH